MPSPPDRPRFRTIDLKPNAGEMLKPAETIDTIGIEALTLQDRRIWNALLSNAFGPELGEEDREFTIPLSALRDKHKGNERIEDSIERLMKTIVRYRHGGKTSRFQLLGGNDMGEETRSHGFLTYTFDRRLADLLKHSTMFGKLEMAVMYAFQSKYALALYEHLSRRVRMNRVILENHTVEEMRQILGVPSGRLKVFGSLKQKAIDPAIEEVNALAPFEVRMGAKRTGRKITHITVTWSWKDSDGLREATAELGRSKIGRKARIKGLSESIVDLERATSDLFSGSAAK